MDRTPFTLPMGFSTLLNAFCQTVTKLLFKIPCLSPFSLPFTHHHLTYINLYSSASLCQLLSKPDIFCLSLVDPIVFNIWLLQHTF